MFYVTAFTHAISLEWQNLTEVKCFPGSLFCPVKNANGKIDENLTMANISCCTVYVYHLIMFHTAPDKM